MVAPSTAATRAATTAPPSVRANTATALRSAVPGAAVVDSGVTEPADDVRAARRQASPPTVPAR